MSGFEALKQLNGRSGMDMNRGSSDLTLQHGDNEMVFLLGSKRSLGDAQPYPNAQRGDQGEGDHVEAEE